MDEENNNKDRLNKLFSEVEKAEENIEQLKVERECIISGIKEDIKCWYKKRLVLIFGGFSLILVYSLFQIYFSVKNKTETFVTEKITQKFDEPQIAQTFTSVAENEAKKIIEDRLTPAIKEANKTVSVKIGYFEKDLEEFKNKYDIELKKLAQEIDYLKNRNAVLKLSDEAIATGNAASFEKLESIHNSSTDEYIKRSTLSEIFRVKSFFATATRIKGGNFTFTNKTGAILKEDEIPTDELIRILRESEPWQTRAKSAELLKNRKEKHVPEALLDAIKNDSNLEVRKKAMDSFELVTGFESPDVFKYDPANKWWEENKQNIEKDLKDLQTIENF